MTIEHFMNECMKNNVKKMNEQCYRHSGDAFSAIRKYFFLYRHVHFALSLKCLGPNGINIIYCKVICQVL